MQSRVLRFLAFYGPKGREIRDSHLQLEWLQSVCSPFVSFYIYNPHQQLKEPLQLVRERIVLGKNPGVHR